MTILQGRQGKGKSGLIKASAPSELRAESTVHQSKLADPSRLHIAWLIELPEIDRFFKERYRKSQDNGDDGC